MKVSMYKNSEDRNGLEVDHIKVLQGIAEGRWSSGIQNLRLLLQSSEVDRYAESKKSLPSVTFSGTFSVRAMDAITEYTGMMVLDIDKLTEGQINNYRKLFKEDPFIYCYFISPSGNGLKVIIKNVGRLPEHHLHAFLALEQYFKNKYAVSIDKSGKDVSRLCYISWDPELYINENSGTFIYDVEEVEKNLGPQKIDFDKRPEQFRGHVISKDAKYVFGICEKWTQRNHQYVEGNRNNYIHVLACNLNRAGVHTDDALLMVYNTYSDLSFKEIETTVRSAYKRTNEHNAVDVYNMEENDLPDHAEELGLTGEEETIFKDTIELLKRGVPKNVIAKLIKNFGIAFFGMDENHVSNVMNTAVKKFKEEQSEDTLPSMSVEEALMDAIDNYQDTGGISSLISEVDEATNGGIMPGSVYGFIGKGGSFKSLYVQCIGSEAAKKDQLTVILNGEMSGMQLLDRQANKELNIDLLGGLRSGKITRDDIPAIAAKLKEVLKDNLHIVSNAGWNAVKIISTVRALESKYKKKVTLIIVDGLTQMEDSKNDEIRSAIFNSGELKTIAKETNTAVCVLVHVSGGIEKHVRDTSKYVRGGDKVINNMDAMFCTSLLIDEHNSDMDNGDLLYIKNKFYLRFIDKRGSGSIISKIIQVNRPMAIEPLDVEPQAMEVNLNK